MIELKYKKISAEILRLAEKVYSSEESWVMTIFVMLSILISSGVFQGLKFFTVLFFLSAIFLYIKLRDFTLSFFLVTLFSLQFFGPNKYYLVEAIRGTELLEIAYREGYWLGYGLNLSNIFLGLTLISFFRTILEKKVAFLRMPRHIIGLFICCICFLSFGYYVNSLYSPYPTLSIVWLLQYSQVFFIGFFTWFYLRKTHSRSSLYALFLASIFFQSSVAFLQFIQQSYVGLPYESGTGTTFYTGFDENNALFRVAGSLMFHNQLALVSAVWLSIILPIAVTTRKKMELFACLLCLLMILLTQSRSIWIVTALLMFFHLRAYKSDIAKIVASIGLRKIITYFSLFFIVFSFVLIPRVILSMNVGYEGAGLPVRFRLLEEGSQVFVQNPWLGFGVGTNEYVLHKYFPEGISAVFPAAIHFAYLQFLLEIGIIGSVFFFLPFYFLLRSLIGKFTFTQSSINLKIERSTFFMGCWVFGIYYLFLPHVGIVEFGYLGIILGFGLHAHTLQHSQ